MIKLWFWYSRVVRKTHPCGGEMTPIAWRYSPKFLLSRVGSISLTLIGKIIILCVSDFIGFWLSFCEKKYMLLC